MADRKVRRYDLDSDFGQIVARKPFFEEEWIEAAAADATDEDEDVVEEDSDAEDAFCDEEDFNDEDDDYLDEED